MIVPNTLDGQTIALDAERAAPRQRRPVRRHQQGRDDHHGPRPSSRAERCWSGISGGEFGVHGRLTALDLGTGKIAWRAYHTGPDDQVLVGKNFHPFVRL